MRQTVTEEMLNHLVPDSSQQDLLERFSKTHHGDMFTPLSVEGTIVFPGLDGGGEWGGPSVDPKTGILYVNANEMPWLLTLFKTDMQPVANETNFIAGQRLYRTNCATCHGQDRAGAGNAPNIQHAADKYDIKTFLDLVSNGRRMMPGFSRLSDSERDAIASFVLGVDSLKNKPFTAPDDPEKEYRHLQYSVRVDKFLTKEGYPGIDPPWGTLSAVDLRNGEYLWRDTLGDYPYFKEKGIHTGTENYGGPVTTAGGLLFIAASRDGKFRAYNKRTGKLLWETDLPAPGFATPAVYEVDGREFVVIACGGGKLNTPSGDAYMAFALEK